MSSPKEILSQSLLQKLESDLFSYVTSMIEDNDNIISDEIKEIVSGLLVSSDIVNEDEAANFCSDLISKLSIHNGTASSVSATLPKSPALETPIILQSVPPIFPSVSKSPSIPLSSAKPTGNNQKEEASVSVSTVYSSKAATSMSTHSSDSVNNHTSETVSITATATTSSSTTTTTTTKEKKDRKPKLNKKATPAEVAELRALEIEQELYEARVLAARERSRLGAYNGALEATHFTLPNPGLFEYVLMSNLGTH